jgi:hypothetical protein
VFVLVKSLDFLWFSIAKKGANWFYMLLLTSAMNFSTTFFLMVSRARAADAFACQARNKDETHVPKKPEERNPKDIVFSNFSVCLTIYNLK